MTPPFPGREGGLGGLGWSLTPPFPGREGGLGGLGWSLTPPFPGREGGLGGLGLPIALKRILQAAWKLILGMTLQPDRE
ncbi:MAG TPA: hypothetical protein DEG17_11555 [Cyanobacteria bacterium UBA11149]|nr:hypothetical protein [Cyanobacteria bacterium UBA11366]HBK65258.1 hypothetical protein [Cyanobacteria bacterium UBA11166]HBR74044.1 hypothetical protein [Cyanobacteria bacterium UBA11159]HBW89483.1 hypothetical protein [Cyanobacteria bacterium UBA11149]HCA94028.1 hypothetical protein [Cyanobacteria bacterium UBA9226]